LWHWLGVVMTQSEHTKKFVGGKKNTTNIVVCKFILVVYTFRRTEANVKGNGCLTGQKNVCEIPWPFVAHLLSPQLTSDAESFLLCPTASTLPPLLLLLWPARCVCADEQANERQPYLGRPLTSFFSFRPLVCCVTRDSGRCFSCF